VDAPWKRRKKEKNRERQNKRRQEKEEEKVEVFGVSKKTARSPELEEEEKQTGWK
jgi:hypothetical protein